MDMENFQLETVNEKHDIDDKVEIASSIASNTVSSLHRSNLVGTFDIGNKSRSSPTQSSVTVDNQSIASEAMAHPTQVLESTSTDTTHGKQTDQCEINSIAEDACFEREKKDGSPRPSQPIAECETTMISSFTTGAESDVIEIHQFSSVDTDAYLDIYFETLHHRLRHHVAHDEQLQEFRTAMKNRINSNLNSLEYHNVLLGKVNGEVVAAVTILFPQESSTLSQLLNLERRNSCLASVRSWMAKKTDYMPTNIEECYIEMIGVKITHRNRSIGSAMLECVEQYAREAGATLLTMHAHGRQVRNYFERAGFIVDNTDSVSFWKWIVERQSVTKLSKVLLPYSNIDHKTNNYFNQSMDSSLDEE